VIVLGKLRPRFIFIVPLVFYLFTAGVATLIILILLKHGGPLPSHEINGQYIRQALPWYGTFEVAILCVMLLLGIWCLYAYLQTVRAERITVESRG
jgi:hypothetical protein